MRAPLYPPARHYNPPAPVPFEAGVTTLSVKELLTSRPIRAMLYEVPGFRAAVEETQLKDHVGNMLLSSFGSMFTPAMLDRVDRALRVLPVQDQPRHD